MSEARQSAERVEQAARDIADATRVRLQMTEGVISFGNVISVISAMMVEAREQRGLDGRERQLAVSMALVYLGAGVVDSPALHAMINAYSLDTIQQLFDIAPDAYRRTVRCCARRC